MIELIYKNTITAWMIGGALLILIESSLIPGIGFLFAGLASIMTGISIWLGFIKIDNYMIQWGWFFAFTCIWAIILWRPLRSFHLSKQNSGYNDIIGTHAVIVSANIDKRALGKIKWSGTFLNARVHPGCPEAIIKEGTEVEIVDVQGNVFLIKPLEN